MSEALSLRNDIIADTGACALVHQLDLQSSWTAEHARRVSYAATLFAEDLGLPTVDAATIGVGGIVHDVGKLHPDVMPIVNSPFKLDEDGRRIIDTHAPIGMDMVVSLRSVTENPLHRQVIKDAAFMTGHHHDEFQALTVGAIHGDKRQVAMTRLLKTLDMYDALRNSRPYRKEAVSAEDTRAYLLEKLQGIKIFGMLPSDVVRLAEHYTQQTLPAVA